MSIVYVIRDPETYEVVYIGRGKHRSRPLQHLRRSHNPRVVERIERWERRRIAPIIEVTAELTDETARSVEAALISSHWDSGTLLNKRRERIGSSSALCSMLLPHQHAERHRMDPLTRRDIAEAGGAVAVYVNARTFEEESGLKRKGAQPALDLNDDTIRDRIIQYWQLGKLARAWAEREAEKPRLLIGVTGPLRRRWVLGALEIDQSGWEQALADAESGYLTVPTKRSGKLDVNKFRGRVIADGAVGPVVKDDGNRRFGPFTHQFFDFIEPAHTSSSAA